MLQIGELGKSEPSRSWRQERAHRILAVVQEERETLVRLKIEAEEVEELLCSARFFPFELRERVLGHYREREQTVCWEITQMEREIARLIG